MVLHFSAFFTVFFVLAGCTHEDDGSPPMLVRTDASLLAEACAVDSTLRTLEQIDNHIADRLPVRAAALIRDTALPSSRRTTEALRAVRVMTPEGRATKELVVAAYSARVAALDVWAQQLSLGETNDAAQLATCRAHREAEQAVLDAIDALEFLRREGRMRPTISRAR